MKYVFKIFIGLELIQYVENWNPYRSILLQKMVVGNPLKVFFKLLEQFSALSAFTLKSGLVKIVFKDFYLKMLLCNVLYQL